MFVYRLQAVEARDRGALQAIAKFNCKPFGSTSVKVPYTLQQLIDQADGSSGLRSIELGVNDV